MHIFHRLKKGNATGGGGVLAEYLGALSTDQRLRLICFAREVLEGTMSMTASWSVAVVCLIAKVPVPQGPSDYRPIAVLPTMFKLVMRLWILEGSSYLALRHKSSHGFRATYQTAEVHLAILAKRRAWGLSTYVCKLDIRKTYDTVSWAAVAALFDRRGLPQWLRAAYWRAHLGRQFRFVSADGAVSSATTARRGMPQGSPESPLVYAALIERHRRPEGCWSEVELVRVLTRARCGGFQ